MCSQSGDIQYSCGHTERRTPRPCGRSPFWRLGEEKARGMGVCDGRFAQVIRTYLHNVPCSICGPGSESRRTFALQTLRR
jgi:hypothetical protein